LINPLELLFQRFVVILFHTATAQPSILHLRVELVINTNLHNGLHKSIFLLGVNAGKLSKIFAKAEITCISEAHGRLHKGIFIVTKSLPLQFSQRSACTKQQKRHESCLERHVG